MNYPAQIEGMVDDAFVGILNDFERFYKGVRGIEKADIDNLLKDVDFASAYRKRIDDIIYNAKEDD